MATVHLPGGTTTGIGSLPFRDACDAASFALSVMTLPAMPALPKRSPAEGIIAQGLTGVQGFTVGQYGSIAADVDRLDPEAPVQTDLGHHAFTGFRAFLVAAAGRIEPVKWQTVGPLTLGLAMIRGGAPPEKAFAVAGRAVRARIHALHRQIDAALPGCAQVVFIDEPSFAEILEPGFPLDPEAAIDLVSSAVAAVEPVALAGVHACGEADVASVLSVGPGVVSLPLRTSLAGATGYLGRFLRRGGTIAWGVVPTDGPITSSIERLWRDLVSVWSELVANGVDPGELARQSMITPECGLASHAPTVAQRVHRMVTEIGRRVGEQAAGGGLAVRW
jgi:methionine synthase II (cobalamin-independent)